MAPVIEIDDLSTHIQLSKSVVQAVGNINLHIEPGETLGLVGESGCGKSMTGLSIMGLLPPGGSIVSGSIKLEDRELVGLPDADLRKIRGNEIAMIFQDPLTSLDPTKTIGYQVAEPVRLHRNVTRGEAMERAAEVLGLVGLPKPQERLKDYPHQLSGGLRQRVMIAMALSCEPKLLIADEPTTALDVTIQAQILKLLDDLKTRLGMAMLLITHDMGVIAGHADRVQRDVRGPDRRDRRDRQPVHQHAPPVHPGAAGLDPAAQPGREPAAAEHPWPAARPDQPAGGLPVRRALQQGDRQVPHRRAAADRRERRAPLRLLAPGGRPDRGGRTAAKTRGDGGQGSPGRRGCDEAAAEVLPGTVLLEVRNIVKEYPITSGAILQRRAGAVHAVSDVSFTVNAGETFGLVGESGCGKTTIGKLIVALEHPTAGKVLLAGRDISALQGQRAAQDTARTCS